MIELKNINKSFEGRQVLKNLNLTLETAPYALMGRSGVGKTTIVNILTGLVSPDSGSITGLDNTRISITFQEDRLIETASVIDNVLLPSKSPKENKHGAIELLSKFELGHVANNKVHTLSGGMKRRVAICRSLIKPFDLLILDEPFKGLDEVTRTFCIDIVKSYVKDKTLLLITHDKEEAKYLDAHRINL